MKFFRHRLWIIAALAFAGWQWLQPHSRPQLIRAKLSRAGTSASQQLAKWMAGQTMGWDDKLSTSVIYRHDLERFLEHRPIVD